MTPPEGSRWWTTADDTVEHARLAESPGAEGPWRAWGPYLSGRQWGTVREDYSEDGDAWSSFPFDHSHARAYRWGEDGLGGICDRYGFLNFSLALWNTHDDRLKERLFGLTNGEGNHGEDVKEYWWAVDGTPSHSWMQWMYRYPHAAFPYDDLRAENWRGPVWFPVNVLLADKLRTIGRHFGDSFTVEIPTGSGRQHTLIEAADLIDGGLTALFRPMGGPGGRRPADGDRIESTDDPLWREHPTFSEYFDGDTGEGLGATHQTGWTALVAHLLNPRLPPDPRRRGWA